MNKIMWIKTPKCGGNSIFSILHSTDIEIVKWGYVKQAIDKFGLKAFDTAYKFAFVRNPFDRAVSSYAYSIKNRWFSGSFKQFAKTPFNDLHQKACQHSQPLTLHLSLHKLEYRKTCFQFYPNQSDFKPDYLNFIGKVENIQEDFNTICDKIGIPQQQLPHKNKTKHKHYTEYYDEETREIVAEKYARDIEYFGYKFGE